MSRKADDQQMGVIGPISAFIGVTIVTAAVMIGGSLESSAMPSLVTSEPIATAVAAPTTPPAPVLSVDEVADLLPLSTLVSADSRDRVVAATRRSQQATKPARPTEVASPGRLATLRFQQPPARPAVAPDPAPNSQGTPAAKAEREQAKADRKAEREQAKADRKAEREQTKAEREQTKADRKAEREQAKADRKADHKADRKGQDKRR